MRKYFKVKDQTFYLDAEIDIKMIPVEVKNISIITSALKCALSIMEITDAENTHKHCIESIIKRLENISPIKIEPEEYTKLITL